MGNCVNSVNEKIKDCLLPGSFSVKLINSIVWKVALGEVWNSRLLLSSNNVQLLIGWNGVVPNALWQWKD